ncbi:hypothetical protein RND81_12G103100 [Saponaria officinalis]|uniref:RING-type E3 ubiquitin transferase n=1 Tax=Saponaria officinalis TaxID=3572 RepID=A0AAW1H8V4_SAPOF
MNIPNVNVIILISSIFQFTKISSTNQPCSPLNKNSCPCSGFESYCQLETGYTFLNFPKSGSFIVKNIDYTNREIRLFDPERCLAEKMMFLNITSTPFQYKSKYNQYYMLYKCYVRNDDEIIINNRDVHVINCLSSKNYTVVSAPWNYSMPPCEAVNGGGGPVVLPLDNNSNDSHITRLTRNVLRSLVPGQDTSNETFFNNNNRSSYGHK